jgi:hypothetical protein
LSYPFSSTTTTTATAYDFYTIGCSTKQDRPTFIKKLKNVNVGLFLDLFLKIQDYTQAQKTTEELENVICLLYKQIFEILRAISIPDYEKIKDDPDNGDYTPKSENMY